MDDSGNESAKLEFAGYVIGIENEFPSGIRPNMVGGFVVFPRSDEVEVDESELCRLKRSPWGKRS